MLLLRQGSARDCTQYSLSGVLKWALHFPSDFDNSRSKLVSDSDIWFQMQSCNSQDDKSHILLLQ